MRIFESNNFKLKEVQKGAPSIMTINYPKRLLVLFYGRDCKYCPAAKKVFDNIQNSLGLEDREIELGMVNLTLHETLPAMSQTSTLPIKYVPLIVYYQNGVPLKEFKGEVTEENIIKFLKTVMAQKPDAHPKPPQLEDAFQPLSKKVCYLDWADAYNGSSNGQNQPNGRGPEGH
jgi:thioredoxin-like negative regulator of GroEL